jgi:peptidoglycan/xylan/chitin deacetylase (PgdA/CDA1 family)
MDGERDHRGRWPEGYRAALCVSIDVDGRYGEANYRALDDTYWLSQTAYDPTGTNRLLDVLADAGVAATFCWVGRVAEERSDLVVRAVTEGHEIALHSWDHRYANRLTDDEQRSDMTRTLETLTRIAGTAPIGHKSAGWRFNDFTHALAQELGLRWVMDEPGGDVPYLILPDLSRPPLVQLPPSAWFDDYTFFVDHVLPPSQAFECWREDLDVLRAEAKLMCLTLHPFVSGRPGPSRTLVRLLDHAIDAGDIWIARADQIAAWWLSRSVTALDGAG